jgi:hypothetical protein
MQTIRAQVRSSQRINVGISYPQRVTAQIRQGSAGGASGGGKGYYLVNRKRKIIQMTTEGE